MTDMMDITDNNCRLCPRECKADRRSAGSGYCRVGTSVKIARAALHMWEEPCISGEEGSGAVFFSGCNLGCVYCQNAAISRGRVGKEVSVLQLAEIYLKLQAQNANNINLVTPSHYALQIAESIKTARRMGLNIPIVYNTGSYEKVETLRLLDGLIDVYLPDCKYYDDERAIRYSNAPRYFETACDAIGEMLRQVGTSVFDERGIMQKGVIVRHMMLPKGRSDSQKIVKALYEKFGDEIFMSLMSQYTPMDGVDYAKYPELEKRVSKRQYEALVDYAIELGVSNAYIQEGNVAKESFIPPFDLSGV